MRRTRTILATITAVLLLGGQPGVWSRIVAADTVDVPSLTISQLKITSSNGQFITLYNASPVAVDMSRYQLQYFNNYDLGKATSSKLIALSGTLPPHGYYMINDGPLYLCYQMMVDSVSLGLSSTAGMIQLMSYSQNSAGGAVAPTLEDYVGWSKTATTGAQTLPASSDAFLRRLPVDGNGNPDIAAPGIGSWQAVRPDANNACNLVSATSAALPINIGLSQLLLGAEPAATVINEVGQIVSSGGAAMPAANIGLMAPRITEILPNPLGTGNDSTDEFIELYNPNPVNFDLSGSMIQTGLTGSRSYTFPEGTILPASSFKAYSSAETKLGLSNTSGQAKLLDPLGNTISATDAYGTAKDGNAWALANSKWLWTTTPTPDKANVIKEPVSSKKAATTAKSKAKKSVAAAKGAKTKLATTNAGGYEDEPSIIPVHMRTIALVVAGALLYGAYEYRADLANRIHQFRRYIGARRANRP